MPARLWTIAARAIAIAACLAVPCAGHAQLFKCFDEKGRVTYSDAPCVSVVPPRPGPGAVGKINREQALAFMTSFDKALARVDLDRVIEHFADDALIQVQVKSQRSGGSGTIGKAEFRRLLREAKDSFWDYRLQRNIVEVRLTADGSQAEVQSEVTEWWKDPGGAMTVKSKETYTIEMRAGKPRATALHVVTRDPEPQAMRQ